MAWAQAPSAAMGTSVAAHQALVAADQAWAAVPDGEPDAWTVYVVLLEDARVHVELLDQVIQPDDAAAYLCLLDRKDRAVQGHMPQERGSCFESAALEQWTLSYTTIECSGLYSLRGVQRGDGATSVRLMPTLRPRRWVVNGDGDCLKRAPGERRGELLPAVIQTTDRQGNVEWTGVSDTAPWQAAGLRRRRPVAAAAMLGTAGVAAGLYGFATYQLVRFEGQRGDFHGAPYGAAAGSAFADDAARYQQLQTGVLISGSAVALLSAGCVLGFVVPW